MRSVRLSKTFLNQLAEYLAFGEDRFGRAVADQKEAKVLKIIADEIAFNPALKKRDRSLGLVVYPISKTPFFIVYDYDATRFESTSFSSRENR